MRSASGGPRVLLRRLRETMAEQVSAQERLDKGGDDDPEGNPTDGPGGEDRGTFSVLAAKPPGKTAHSTGRRIAGRVSGRQ